jgi:trimethylamine--corrinoid protein Co-methyltransferase
MVIIHFLSSENLSHIDGASLQILEKTGVIVKNTEAMSLLGDAGCIINTGRILIPQELVKECIKKVPSTFDVFSREGKRSDSIGEDVVLFNPGSSAAYFRDHSSSEIRKATLQDMEDIVHTVNHLDFIKAQSTSVIPSDVPEHISDLYRLYVILKLSSKPIVTGAFSISGFQTMKRMLEFVSGGADELAKKPRAIFDCCPSSPLVWGDTTCQNLIDCAKSKIPAEIVPAPISGATSPVSLYGTLIQSNTEILSGIVISQLVNPNSPIIYGGASSSMDMKIGLPRFGSAEAIMMACASTELGKYYGFPTHSYIGSSDSKIEDSQSGFESGVGLVIGALSGTNIISGPGMLAQLNCQSLEKLVIDNEICGTAYRLKKGIDRSDAELMANLIDEVGPAGDYMKNKYTAKKFRSEFFMPSDIVCALGFDAWVASGKKQMFNRAHEKVSSLLLKPADDMLPKRDLSRLDVILKEAIKTDHPIA